MRATAVLSLILVMGCGPAVDSESGRGTTGPGGDSSSSGGTSSGSVTTETDTTSSTSANPSSGSSSSSGGSPELPCGCPDPKDVEQSGPDFADPTVFCDPDPQPCGQAVVPCPTRVPDGNACLDSLPPLSDDTTQSLDCMLSAVERLVPGQYTLGVEFGLSSAETRRLFLAAEGNAVAVTRVGNFAGVSMVTTGLVDPSQAAACAAIDDDNGRFACTWALFELENEPDCP